MNTNSTTNNPICTDSTLGDMLEAYALGTLSERDAERFEEHYFLCDCCRLQLSATEEVFELLREHRHDLQDQLIAVGEDYASLRRDARLGKALPWWKSFSANLSAVLTSRLTIGTSLATIAVTLLFRFGPALPPRLAHNSPPVHTLEAPQHNQHPVAQSTNPSQLDSGLRSSGTAHGLSAPSLLNPDAGTLLKRMPETANQTESLATAGPYDRNAPPSPNNSESLYDAPRFLASMQSPNNSRSAEQSTASTGQFSRDNPPDMGTLADKYELTKERDSANKPLNNLRGDIERKPLKVSAVIEERELKPLAESSKMRSSSSGAKPHDNAWRAYEKEDYQTALRLFERGMQSGSTDCDDVLYAGVCAYMLEDNVATQRYLQQVLESPGCTDLEARTHAAWYYAHALLRLGRLDDAKPILTEIAGYGAEKSKLSGRAFEIVKKIRKAK
jgi:anti-sigma factor RsiW